jgi:hypothetical protein
MPFLPAFKNPEITLPPFLKEIEKLATPERIYSTEAYADMTLSPVPDYHLLSLKSYASRICSSPAVVPLPVISVRSFRCWDTR